MPGHVCIETVTFEDLGDGRTRVVTTSLFHTTEDRDGMLQSGMEQGLKRELRGARPPARSSGLNQGEYRVLISGCNSEPHAGRARAG
jgi:hypothetical protein